MKAPMKKLQLLVFYRNKENVTQQLEDLGALHIEVDDKASDTDTQQIDSKLSDFEKALQIVEKSSNGQAKPQLAKYAKQNSDNESTEGLKDHVIELKKKIEQTQQALDKKQKEAQLLAPWGNFTWENISKLERQGIKTFFHAVPNKQFNKYDFGELTYAVINRLNGQVYFVIFSKETPDTPFDKLKLPNQTLAETKSHIEDLGKEKNALEQQLIDLGYQEQKLKEAITETSFKKLKNKVNLSYQQLAEGKILLLKGWFPENIEDKIRQYLENHKMAFKISMPKATDRVPVLLTNKKYPKLFENITRLFQLPHYYEMDLTPFIAVFYPIFFAYCLGDSGYGLVLLIASIIAANTILKDNKNIAVLGGILGVITMFMGIVKSGSIFGVGILENQDSAFLQVFAPYVIIPDDQSYVFNAFNVALMIGLFQLLFAVILSAIKKWYYLSFKHAIFPIGKFLIMVGAVGYFLGSMQGVEAFVPYIGTAQILLVSGILLVVFFHDTEMPILQRTGGSVLPLFFIFTGLLGDTLSYVRLFALGVSSSVLGLVVNQIGMQMMGGLLGTLFAILFLIFGHSLNFLLAALGAFVHPLRLTFVEFYNNVEFEGGGVEFKPFKKPDKAAMQ